MFDFPTPYEVATLIPAVVIALTFHEYAHAVVAYKLGDPTAKHSGRLTLNPIPHVDPIGMLMLFFVGFGWAKPVPVNPYNFNKPKRDMVLVSLAGPLSNVILAIAFALLFGVFYAFGSQFLIDVVEKIIWINVVLAVFNMLPIPPLDGSKILAGILPGDSAWLNYLEQYGFIILIILLLTGILRPILMFFIEPLWALVQVFVGIGLLLF
ncbi:site-2 protease family protein [Peptococcaceae bacterium]|nr:site-2 protease family protein [Peptococcaceae bacterium]